VRRGWLVRVSRAMMEDTALAERAVIGWCVARAAEPGPLRIVPDPATGKVVWYDPKPGDLLYTGEGWAAAYVSVDGPPAGP
jgi:hypothetical protein